MMKNLLKTVRKSRGYKVAAYRFWQISRAPFFLVARSRPVIAWQTRALTREYARDTHELSAVQAGVLEDLRRDGIAVTHLDDFFGERGMLQKLTGEAERLIERGNVYGNPKKSFLFYFLKFLRGTSDIPDIKSPFFLFALEPKILEVVSSYFKTYPILHFLSAAVSRVVPPGTEEDTSQRWHRDPGSDMICKVFLYLNDVDATTGPFMYVAGSQPGGRNRGLLAHRFFGVGSYYPDFSKVERLLDKTGKRRDLRKCTGRAGTMIFCNTLGLHRGGYATGKERLMVTADYQRIPLEQKVRDAYNTLFPEFESALADLAPLSHRALF